jgi:hypothetical protein
LKFVRCRKVFGVHSWWLVFRLRPHRVPHFPPFPRTQAIQGQTERDSNEPRAEPRPVAQTIEPPVRAKHRFLSYILGVSGIAQYAARHAVSNRSTFGKALFEFTSRLRLGCPVFQLIPDRATWLDQNQLLHWLS